MSWGLVAAAGATIIGGVMQKKSADKAADATSQGSAEAIAEQRRQFDLIQSNNAPYLQAGQSGLAALAGNKYEESPGYQYLQDEGLRIADASAASRGSLYSGGHPLGLMRHAQGIAAQDYGNWWGRQMGLAGLGQASANNQAAAGMGMANNIGGYMQNAADGRASSYLAQGNNWANSINGLGQAASSYFGSRSVPQAATYPTQTYPQQTAGNSWIGPRG